MKALIVYDADGTSRMTVEAEHISTQLWDGGRALVKLSNAGLVDRALHFARIYLIDVDCTPTDDSREGQP